MPAPRFTDKTLRFLRALKRYNDREWFREHRDDYERHVRKPMIKILERLSVDLRSFAPDLVASPQVSTYRIYRDTRFSANKSPYKTQVAAIMPHRMLTKHGGAGLYFHVAPGEVLVGAGIYAPETRQLYQLRQHIASNVKRFQSIVESTTFRRRFGRLTGKQLQRVPRGFSKDDPAANYLKLQQLLVAHHQPAIFATRPRFYYSLLGLFEHLAPFVAFLNDPLVRNKRFRLES